MWEASHLLMGEGWAISDASGLRSVASLSTGCSAILRHVDLTFSSLVDPTGSDEVRVGFYSEPTKSADEHGEVWISLTPTGQVTVTARKDGGEVELLPAGGPHPAFLSGELNRLTLSVDRRTWEVMAALNEEELQLQTPNLSQIGLQPTLAWASVEGFKAGGFSEVGAFRFDNVWLGSANPLRVVESPVDRVAPAGMATNLRVDVEYGVPPLTFQWERRRRFCSPAEGCLNPIGGIAVGPYEPLDVGAGQGVYSGSDSAELVLTPPNTHWSGDYRCAITDAGGAVAVSEPALVRVVAPQISDHFEQAGSPLRAAGMPLHNAPVQAGSVVWAATAGPGFGNQAETVNQLTNLNLDQAQIATVPFDLQDYFDPGGPEGYRYSSVEANIGPIQTGWVGVGFSDHPTGDFWTHGAIWAFIKQNGEFNVKADGLNIGILSSFPDPHPVVDPGGRNHVRLVLDNVTNMLTVWLNHHDLGTFDLDDHEYQPQISTAGINAWANPPYGTANSLQIDGFAVTVHGLLGGFGISVSPEDTLAQQGWPTTLHARADGGFAPYGYQWQYCDPALGTCETEPEWADISSATFGDGLVRGWGSRDLVFDAVSPDHEGQYRVIVWDSAPEEPVGLVSPAAFLDVTHEFPACNQFEPPIDDFRAPVCAGDTWTSNQMEMWHTVNCNQEGVSFAATIYSDPDHGYGSVEKAGLLVPTNSSTVRFEFKDVVGGGGQATLHWDGGPPNGHPITIPGDDSFVEVDLSSDDTWLAGDANGGYVRRNVGIRFESAVSGQLLRFEALEERKHLEFLAEPELHADVHGSDVSDPPINPGNVAAAAVFRIQIEIHNQGCDADDPGQNLRFHYTLCKKNDPDHCRPDLFDDLMCDDGQTTAAWPYNLYNPAVHALCELRMPENHPDNLTDWVLQAHFDADPTRSSDPLEFTLQDTGKPNLRIVADATVQACANDGPGCAHVSWLRTDEPFQLRFSAVSDAYSADGVVAHVSARSRVPGLFTGDWMFLGSKVTDLHTYSETMVLNDLDPALVLPIDRDWGLVDLRIELDPFDAIDEVDGLEGDNVFEAPSWIMVSRHEPGPSLGQIILEEEFQDPGDIPLHAYMNVAHNDLIGDSIHGAYDETPDKEPYLYWLVPEPATPGAIAIRFKKSFTPPHEHTAFIVEPGHHPPGIDLPSLDQCSEHEAFAEDQWEVALWKATSGLCTSEIGDLPPLAGVTLESKLIGAGPLQLSTVFMGFDNNPAWNISYWPAINIDYVRVWEAEPAPDLTFDASVSRLLFLNDAAVSKSSDDGWYGLPDHVMPNTPWKLGIEIEVWPPDPDGTEIPATINVERHPPVGEAVSRVARTPAPRDPTGRFWVYTVDEDPWTPTHSGDYHHDVTIPVSDDNPVNNVRRVTTRVDHSCPAPPVDLP